MSSPIDEFKMDKVGVPEAKQAKGKYKKSGNNPISVLFFYKTVKLFMRGNKKELEIEDLGETVKADLSEPLGDALERNWYKELARAKEKGRKPALWRALFWTFIWGYLIDGGLLFVQMMLCRPFQPVLLALLVSHFGPGGPTRQEACQYAGALVGFSLLAVIIQHHVSLRQMQRGMRMRIACCSLLYRKILRLSTASLGQITAGQVVNLMSNDVSRFDTVLMWLHYIWIMPFQISLMCYLIFTQVNMAALVGVLGIVLQTMPVQSFLSRLTSKLRMKIAKRTDERVRLMNEVINGIQVIKMYAWEKPFEKIVSAAREHELSAVMGASYLRGVYMSFMVFTERASLYITLLAYSLMGNPISAPAVFSLAQFYNQLQGTLAFHYPNAVSQGAECLVTCTRIQDFLMLQERDQTKELPDLKPKKNDKRIYSEKFISRMEGIGNLGFEIDGHKKCDLPQMGEGLDKDSSKNSGIVLKDMIASWGQQPTLNNVSLTIPQGKLCAIIGSVGSGKSSFLQLLLKELPQNSGQLKMSGSISYSSQEPWLFVATVRNNILFGLPYDQERYKEVVKVCALEADLQQFPRGDQTLVGERGVSLSGGQRARINLARAVYRQADIYLLDDPLSAVDAPVGRHLYENCIEGYLAGKTRVLVTHQLHYLKEADLIIILKDGQVENIGTYNELAASGKQFSQLLQDVEETTAEDEERAKTRKEALHTSVLSGTSKDYRPDQDQMEAEQEVEEESGKGRVGASLYWRYWAAAKNNSLFCFMLLAMVFGQLTATFSDYWVTFWSNEQSKIDLQNSDRPMEGRLYASGLISNQSQGIYAYPGHLLKPGHPLASGPNHTAPVFSIWDHVGPLTTAEYLYVYTGIIFACVFFVTARSFVFYQCCMRSSKGLHNEMFRKMLRGTMRFFDTNPSGRILNRFSKDVGAVDELLPRAYIEVFQIWLVFLSIMGLVSATNPWLLMPIAFILLVFYLALQLYLNTAQDVKRLESVYRSPVFSHLTASLNGIVTIRAANSQKRLVEEFDQLQDVHTLAWYQYLACSCTLGFWLDIVCILFLACVCYSFIFFDGENVSSGNVGLAVSQTMILMGMLQFGVRQIAEVVAQMTSVERVLQYTRIQEEPGLDHGARDTPKSWPSTGAISFKGTKLFYSPTDPPVLKDLNFDIKSGWKVGIVGRTGAGKSSLIAALFRLAPMEGDISIDGVHTGDICLQDVRSNISIIPQEPVLFSATVRYNLDPLEKYRDDHLWSALEAVELKEVITSLEQHVCEGGSNFSLGQRQLLCLARAILRNNQILVLDEATANVDPQTDFFIQKTIRDKFSHCTVLTIAHRLNTVMDSDHVLVMEAGRMVEYDHPHILLNNKSGHLYNMVKETGTNMANTLANVAKMSYEQTVGVSPLSIDDVSSNIVPSSNNIDAISINVVPSSNNIDSISTNAVPSLNNIDAISTNVVPSSNNFEAISSHVVPMSNNVDRDVQNSLQNEKICRNSVKEIDFDETNRFKEDLIRPNVDGNISHFENGINEPDRK